ncbi:MAG: toxin HicA [SAR324 cluster bacterium]|nr:toxin HicA [SAR324 cluster bacterium]
MTNMKQKLKELRNNLKDVKFADLCKICEFYFGKPRQTGTSHRIYKTPWQGNPRVNIQNYKGKAKAYQVKQVLKSIERLEVEHDA